MDSFNLDGQPIECQRGDDYYYDDFDFKNSVVTEFDLVCKDQFKVVSTFLSP